MRDGGRAAPRAHGRGHDRPARRDHDSRSLRQREAQLKEGIAAPTEDIDLESAEAAFRYHPEWVVDRIARAQY
jgi:hypothetical protein